MDKLLIIGLVLHFIIAIVLMISLWRKDETILAKFIWSLIILVPFIGPVIYGAFFDPLLNKIGNKTKITKSDAIKHALAADHFNDR